MFCRHFFKNGPNPAAFLHTVTHKEQNLTINGKSADVVLRDSNSGLQDGRADETTELF